MSDEELPPDLKEARELGISLFAGEGEGRILPLLHDINAGTLKPVYNYLADMPEMAAATLPILPLRWRPSAPRFARSSAGCG